MKRTLKIATLMLGLSVVAGSAYAASNNDMWDTTKSSEPVNLEEMAKEKGVTVDELIAQLEEEGKLTEGVETTSSTETAEDSKSSESVNLEEMAKEKGVTVDELIAQLEKEGKLTKAAEATDSTEAKQVETNNK
ncbi:MULTISPECIES: hypothetical protein [unclassified Viridibacillus]|uniref:hypothetical protein n=1 Tax=unclassified Viridibacillus TaxID=2617942 RepID=UPI00096EDE45|nr:hypothetical protein [Viridibacillus sp. FSL H8-0123]OMC80896.1 hypothetical protein BK130_16360 [Viridibacillus sp. FSL H8-0123]